MLRKQDRAWLFELHPKDFELLNRIFSNKANFRARCEDGFKGLMGLLPTASRRAFVLIDPPYELKEDYQLIWQSLEKAYRKMATGVFAVWYPVVERERIDGVESKLIESGIKRIVQFELGVAGDS